MSNKKLLMACNILEALIQCLVVLSFTITVIIGTLGFGINKLTGCFIVIIPVVLTYILRKIIRKFQIFTFINIIILLSSFLLGADYTERFSYVLIYFVIFVYSMRAKYKAIKYKEVSMQVGESATVQGRDISGRLEEHLFAGEKVPIAFAAVMVLGYFAGYSRGSTIVLNSQVIICVLFILCQILYNNLEKLNDLYINNADKSEFPAQQLKNVNIFTLVITCVLVLIGMLVFYNGEYGNIFSIISDVGMSGLRAFLKGFIFLLGLFEGKQTDMNEMDTQTEETTEGLISPEDVYQPSHVAEAVAEAVGVVLIAACVIALVWFVVRYVKQINKTKKLGTDTVEYVRPKKSSIKTENNVYVTQEIISEQKNNKAARKYYKKRVKKGFGRKKPEKTYTPQQLTKYGITADDDNARRITDAYEKARYSNQAVTDEELNILKKL